MDTAHKDYAELYAIRDAVQDIHPQFHGHMRMTNYQSLLFIRHKTGIFLTIIFKINNDQYGIEECRTLDTQYVLTASPTAMDEIATIVLAQYEAFTHRQQTTRFSRSHYNAIS